jgi:hypothetical protein
MVTEIFSFYPFNSTPFMLMRKCEEMLVMCLFAANDKEIVLTLTLRQYDASAYHQASRRSFALFTYWPFFYYLFSCTSYTYTTNNNKHNKQQKIYNYNQHQRVTSNKYLSLFVIWSPLAFIRLIFYLST